MNWVNIYIFSSQYYYWKYVVLFSIGLPTSKGVSGDYLENLRCSACLQSNMDNADEKVTRWIGTVITRASLFVLIFIIIAMIGWRCQASLPHVPKVDFEVGIWCFKVNSIFYKRLREKLRGQKRPTSNICKKVTYFYSMDKNGRRRRKFEPILKCDVSCTLGVFVQSDFGHVPQITKVTN